VLLQFDFHRNVDFALVDNLQMAAWWIELVGFG
jgi:hypothetical protein